jgi:thioredoxin 1
MAGIITVKSEAHFTEVISSPKVNVIVFTATWCVPCRQIAPEFERLAFQYAGEVNFVKVDADDHPEILEKCLVVVLPTFMVVHQGEQLGAVIGGEISEVKELVRSSVRSEYSL